MSPLKVYGNNYIPEYYYRNGAYFAQFLILDCNSKCDFCIVRGRGEIPKRTTIPARDILNFWNTLAHPEGYRLSLLGGEPTLRPDIIEIVNNLEGYYVTLTTNLGSKFYDNPQNISNMRKDNLRINTSFHPSVITIDKFVSVIYKLKDAGFYVDQLDLVNHPNCDFNYYREEFAKRGLSLSYAPFLGFYKGGKYAGSLDLNKKLNEYGVDELYPNETEGDKEHLKRKCGIEDLERYRTQCGAYTPKKIKSCYHHTRCLLVSPDGNIHDCHYKLYYNIDPVTNIWNTNKLHSIPPEKECSYFGFCNWCDIVRADFNITGNNTPQEIA